MVPRFTIPLNPNYIYYLYIGRRIKIKGFDIVLESFQKAYQSDPSLRLILIGSGEPIRLPGVVDIGQSAEPASWLVVCDYLISANRQSYFDLSVMEALSLGTPIIIAYTGGHLEFGEIQTSGIIPLPELNARTLAEVLLNNRRKRSNNFDAAEANRKLFQDRFSDRRYRSRVERFLNQLFREKYYPCSL
jgi:glycosyltransferase involved in cell wall biosynthesis